MIHIQGNEKGKLKKNPGLEKAKAQLGTAQRAPVTLQVPEGRETISVQSSVDVCEKNR